MFYSRQLSNERSDEDSENNTASHDHIVSIPTDKLTSIIYDLQLMMLIDLLPLFIFK